MTSYVNSHDQNSNNSRRRVKVDATTSLSSSTVLSYIVFIGLVTFYHLSVECYVIPSYSSSSWIGPLSKTTSSSIIHQKKTPIFKSLYSVHRSTQLLASNKEDEEVQDEIQSEGQPQPPKVPPPVSFFATSKEDAEEEAAKKLEAEQQAAAEAAEAARLQAEEEEKARIAKEEDAKRQAEIAAQLLLEAEQKAQQQELERQQREEENQRRQEEFRAWTNNFMEQYINPIGDIERGVSSDRIKGAALTGAALGLLAGNGLGVAGAASLTAAYLSISKGVAGDVLRTVGGIAWDATGTSVRLLDLLSSPTSKLTSSLSTRAMNILQKVQSKQDSITNSTLDGIADMDQLAQDYIDLTKVLEEAEAVIDEADAAIAKAQEDERQAKEAMKVEVDLTIPYDAAAVLAYEASGNEISGIDYNSLVQTPAFVSFKKTWKEQAVAEVIEKTVEKKAVAEKARQAKEMEAEAKRREAELLAEEARAEEMEEEAEAARREAELLAMNEDDEDADDDEGEFYMDDDADEWAAAVEMAQEGLDGTIVGVEEMISDSGAKSEWDAAGALARELNVDEEEDNLFDQDDEADDFDFESLDFSALGDDDEDDDFDLESLDLEALRDSVASFESALKEVNRLREVQKQEWAESMVTSDKDNSNSGHDEEDQIKDYSSMKKPELQELLRSRGLKATGNKGELVERLQNDDVTSTVSMDGGDDDEEDSESDNDLDDFDIGDIDLEELGRQAREAVQMFEGSVSEVNIEEPTEDMLAENENEMSSTPNSSVDYSSMTVAELKAECRTKGMKVSGRKAELIERLQDSS